MKIKTINKANETTIAIDILFINGILELSLRNVNIPDIKAIKKSIFVNKPIK